MENFQDFVLKFFLCIFGNLSRFCLYIFGNLSRPLLCIIGNLINIFCCNLEVYHYFTVHFWKSNQIPYTKIDIISTIPTNKFYGSATI